MILRAVCTEQAVATFNDIRLTTTIVFVNDEIITRYRVIFTPNIDSEEDIARGLKRRFVRVARRCVTSPNWRIFHFAEMRRNVAGKALSLSLSFSGVCSVRIDFSRRDDEEATQLAADASPRYDGARKSDAQEAPVVGNNCRPLYPH